MGTIDQFTLGVNFMTKIREIFDPLKPIERRIEKVITYETTNEELLKQEVIEYVATESIENHFDRLLDAIEEGMTQFRKSIDRYGF